MNIAGKIIVAAALALASAPAFAHGRGGMGGGMDSGHMGGNMGGMGMGHSTGMTGNTQTHTWNLANLGKTNTTGNTHAHHWRTNRTNVGKNKTFFFNKSARLQRELVRLDREVIRLVLDGKAGSRRVRALEARIATLVNAS